MTREFTTKLLDLVEEGTLDAEYALRAALNYMSESSVEEMCGQMDLEEYFEEEEEEEDYDDVILTNIVWESDDLDDAPNLPSTVNLSLISEMLTSGDEYDRTEIEDWLEDKYCMPAVSFDVETD